MTRSKPSVAAYQYRAALAGQSGGGRKRFALSKFDPAAKPFSTGSKARDKAHQGIYRAQVQENSPRALLRFHN